MWLLWGAAEVHLTSVLDRFLIVDMFHAETSCLLPKEEFLCKLPQHLCTSNLQY